jgi:hypothetical protein
VKAEENKNEKAGEPQPAYGSAKKTITISTLEGLQEKNREHTRKLTPAERMDYLLKLNQNLFGFDWSKQVEVLRKGIIHIGRAS